jgi:ring-1,2-phenylacetyl-CoA epoxidase subunit PaaD
MVVAQDVTDRIFGVLAAVPDPEIPALSVVDLGIVRDVDGKAVTITPTYSGCPATLAIELSIRAALDQAGFQDVAVRTVLSPAWTTDCITPQGHDKLRAYGIAPPRSGGSPVECPRCGSSQTQEVSRFGSTPCKAQWRCSDCLEPFDHFKCH